MALIPPFHTGETPTNLPEQIHALTKNTGGNPHESRRSRAAQSAIAEHQESHAVAGPADDVGHLGAFGNNKVILANAHPHQAHSVGLTGEDGHPNKVEYENHGIDAFHVSHHIRDKAPEHHPPGGLYDPEAKNMDTHTQEVF